MKRIVAYIFLISLAVTSLAQVPRGIGYQAVIRNTDGSLVANRLVTASVSLHFFSADSTASYVEKHSLLTNDAGLLSLTIGEGTVIVGSNLEESVDWSRGNWWLKVEIDPNGSDNYEIVLAQKLLAVPYALFAKEVDNRHNDSLLSMLNHRMDSIVSALRGASDNNNATYSSFTISEKMAVHFSMGNLQYLASTNTWRFAEHQYDYIGEDNKYVSPTYDGWIDLFGWATSGWNSGESSNTSYMPYSTDGHGETYGVERNNLVGRYSNGDWGVYNAISNGGNQAGMWRTLSKEEWDYLLNQRSCSAINTTANARYTYAMVNNTKGLILFPDNYYHPHSVPTPTNINGITGTGYTANIYTAEQWHIIEQAGCVFLPITGWRNGTEMWDLSTSGYYWSASYFNGVEAHYLSFDGTLINATDGCNRAFARAVRLVQDVNK